MLRSSRVRRSTGGRSYLVLWEIELTSSAPRAAAVEALRIQRDAASLATVFDVTDARGHTRRIHLLSEQD